MGNRAVICFDEHTEDGIGIYLHWNGGRDSIEGFLLAAQEIMGSRLGDQTYGKARLMQAISTFIGGNLSLGLGQCKDLDCKNGDNGVYVVDSATLTIKDRKFFNNKIEQREHKSEDIAKTIADRIAAANKIE